LSDEFSGGRVLFAVLDDGEPATAMNRGEHVQLLLGAYVLGGLTASQEAAVRAHIDRCERCRAEYEELAVIPSWLDLLVAEDLADDLIPEDLTDDPGETPDGP
jgi:predicted anti-sigma-YlaC factor YlaD